MSIKRSQVSCHRFTNLTRETALLWVGHKGQSGAKKELCVKINVETPVICKESIVEGLVNNVDGLVCQ